MHAQTRFNRESLTPLRQITALAAFLLFLIIFIPSVSHSASSYSKLNEEFKTLSADPKKSAQREPWEKMQAKFDSFVKSNSKSDDAPKAAYMAARCMEEIAVRTHNPKDFNQTVDRFGAVAENYPKTQQGNEALFKKAEIEFKNLKNPEAAQKSITKLLETSRDEALKKRARELEKTMTAAPAPKPDTQPAANPSTPKAEEKPVQTFSEPTLVSVLINASDKEADAEIELSTGAGYSWRFIPKAKTSGGKAALIVEVEGVVPNQGITGLSTVSKGPVQHVSIVKAKVKTASGKDAPSCRVEFTLKDDYSTAVKTETGESKILIKINSAKKQTATASGRGVAGRIEANSSQNSSLNSGSSGNANSASSQSKAEMLGLTVKTILLDPGHGGKDPGAQANGITESKLVLKISKLVETKLKKKGFEVSYTRDNDVFIGLEKRTEIANRRKVDLFVSIHVNANTDTSVAGIETYYLDKAKTKSAERVAARENGVSMANIDDLQVILTDLGLSSKMQESRDLAKDVQNNMEKQVKAGGYTVRTNGVRSGPFYVLMGAKMPAILVEVGYCSNKNDAAYLKNDKYVERIADGIVDGIVAYKKRIESSVE